MLNLYHQTVRENLFCGTFGLERETLRVTDDGYMAQSPHPFNNDEHIVKDFCENQAEINTGVHESAGGVIEELMQQTERLYRAIEDRGELLWMFSNPPYIRSAQDIPVARYEGEQRGKQSYRMYLAEKYGRYKMTLSGIHVNYSFGDELLQADFALSDENDFTEYKNRVYLELAQSLAEYGWIISLLFAASPLLDGSFRNPGRLGRDDFDGDASVRCAFGGYWNSFTPVLDYDSILGYAESIQKYIDNGTLDSVSELYYPVRLKPRGSNRLNALVQNGVNHIELRNVDLNPFAPAGIDERDLKFIELLMIYLSCTPTRPLSQQAQYFAAQNFKAAARFDIDSETIRLSTGETASVREAGLTLLRKMQKLFDAELFTEQERRNADGILAFQRNKLTGQGARYADMVLESFGGGFVANGLDYLKKTRFSTY